MIPRGCKRLAEVDFPIAEVSKHASGEKYIHHGHPATLHIWWARRPLASSRAVLMALLLPDPCDPLCPPAFKAGAREALAAMRERPSGWDADIETDDGLRRTLLRFVAEFSNWDNASKQDYLDTGRAIVRAAHPDETPLVVDPFAGGGAIPLEALRLGCETFASDLNPVSCLILNVMLEDIPRHGPGLAEELRRAGAEIKEKAERELADLYPTDPDGATPIFYLWARTVRCEAPECGAEIPLMRSMWLCRKPNRRFALRPTVTHPTSGPPQVTFEVFEPESDAEVGNGTVSLARATCICCSAVMPPDRVRSQIAAQKGGADAAFNDRGDRIGGARMTAVVTLIPGEQGRHYRTPTKADYDAVYRAQQRVDAILDEWARGGSQGLRPVPDEPLPPIGTSGFRVQRYGMLQWGDLFAARQKAALTLLTDSVRKWESQSDAVSKLLAAAVGKSTDYCSNLATWGLPSEKVSHLFARQAIPMVWDFCESIPISSAAGSWMTQIEYIARVVDKQHTHYAGQVQSADATDHPLPDQSAGVWFTDPPYYNAIPYSDLSDYFLVWLKRALPGHPLLRDLFDPDNPLSPKTAEIVQDESKENDGRRKDGEWFEDTMALAFAEGRRVLSEDGVGSVIFAHKTTAGWEALLSGMIRGGWTITGSWPIATEMRSRLRAIESAALATSVHLVCRPRAEDAKVGDWGEVLRELPARVGDWMDRLQGEGVRGADLVFACIGPALEIYSRYRAVETAEGREVGLEEYLERVWEAVGRAALENVLGTEEAQARNGMAGALEEDARLTALFLWTMQSTGEGAASDDGGGEGGGEEEGNGGARRRPSAYNLPFDVVRRFAQPLGIHLDAWEQSIIRTEKGVVRLLSVRERRERLFGERGADAIADAIESDASASPQLGLFPEPPPAVRGRARRRRREGAEGPVDLETARDATTLDRVHAAMLLQALGRSNALRGMIRGEQERGPDFVRLANALSALYPRGSEEKRLLDAMLLGVGG